MTTATRERTDKEQLLDKVSQFPDAASFEEMSDDIALLAALRRSIADAEAGRVISHEEVKRISATWLTK